MAQEQTRAASSTAQDAGGAEIELEAIRKTFNQGEVVACEDITLDIEAEEFVVLLGPSGCGKTTTLRCIAGLEQPDEGQIRISGEDVTYRKPKDRDLAFVFQSIALFPNKTIRENIQFGLDMKTDLPSEEKNDRVAEVAEMLDIGDLLDRKPDQLSGGQQQRVSLGRAMVMKPAAFLLDEPFSALDAQLRNRMRTEVKRLQRELNTAMVFVTHDQEEAMTLGDKILVMNDGRVQQVGSPYDIYNDPKNLFVANFIGSPSVNTLSCEVTGVDDGIQVSTELFELSIDGERSQSVSVSKRDTLTLAVRPEYLELDGQSSLFDATLEIIEPHGDRDAVFLRSESIDLAAIVDQGHIDAARETVTVNIDRDDVWLFTEDGKRVV